MPQAGTLSLAMLMPESFRHVRASPPCAPIDAVRASGTVVA